MLKSEREKHLENVIREIANQLLVWARESKDGGWSTHQVGPMERKALDLFYEAGLGK